MRSMRAVAPLALLAILATAHDGRAAPILHTHDAVGRLGTVDVATGSATVIGTMTAVMTDIAFAPDGRLFGLDFFNLYTINPLTAAVSLIGSHGVPGANALVFRTDGTLFAAGGSSTNLYTLDPASGAATSLGSIGFASAGDLAFNGGSFFLSSISNQLVRITLGPTLSAVTVGAFGFSNVFGLATADDGILYGLSGTQVLRVDPATGAGTLASSFAGQGLTTAYGSSFTTEAVPEPGTALLLATGLMVLAARRSTKRCS